MADGKGDSEAHKKGSRDEGAITLLRIPWYYFDYHHFPFLGTDGFNVGVLPGVDLLSRWRWSGLPVESAVLFGPGFKGIILVFN